MTANKIIKSRKQYGLSMLLALIALLILSLTAVALIRSVDTDTLIIGNLGFKQDANEAGSIGAESAMSWLESQAILDDDVPANGYYASSLEKLDPTGSNTTAANKLVLVDWDGSGNCTSTKAGTFESCTTQPFPIAANAGISLVNGNRVQWVITRLCKLAAPVSDPNNACTQPGTVGPVTASERGELMSGGRISDSVAGPYYRIIVRTEGPRNTVSFTETIVHF
jgi:Tfp pilus assembly protein PilX